MVHTVIQRNECYIYMNGRLIHKTRTNNSESGVTFDVMAYRKGDSLKSIKSCNSLFILKSLKSSHMCVFIMFV